MRDAMRQKPCNTGGHQYPGCTVDNFCFTSNCDYGCGCWMGQSRSGGPEGIDPFGECPGNPSCPLTELVDA